MTDVGQRAATLQDFSEFGQTETVPLAKIQQVGARILARNWAEIPHVTHQDEADVTEFERRRAEMARRSPDQKSSALSLYAKAVVAALTEFPKFNASLNLAKAELVLKKYFHLGFAIDTPNGLLVAVVRDCDRKSPKEIGDEIAAMAATARAVLATPK